MNIDLLEMKIKESEEEEEVEKLRLKLMEANGKMKVSAEKTSAHGSKTGKGAEVDLKAMEKLSKQAKNDSEDAIKALDRFNKQIAKVEKLRLEIQAEERKIGYVKPWLLLISILVFVVVLLQLSYTQFRINWVTFAVTTTRT